MLFLQLRNEISSMEQKLRIANDEIDNKSANHDDTSARLNDAEQQLKVVS